MIDANVSLYRRENARRSKRVVVRQAGEVLMRIEIYDHRADRTEHARRNDVLVKRRSSDHSVLCRRRERIVDHIAQLREVTASFQVAWHRLQERLPLDGEGLLDVDEEKRLVANDPAAQAAAELILVKCRNLRRIEVVPGIEIRVTEELKRRAVKIVATGLGHQVHQCTARAAGSSVAPAALHLEF